MAAPEVGRIDSGTGAVPADTKIKLRVTPTKAGDKVTWHKDGGEPISGETGETYEFTVTSEKVGKYTAKVDTVTSDPPFAVSLQTESKPFYDKAFAEQASRVIGAASLVVVGVGTWHLVQIPISDWKGTNGNLMFAASLTLPVLVLGGLALGVGLFMAAVEWRGRFQPEKAPTQDKVGTKETGIPAEVSGVIEAIGKLQGATLVLVIGAVLLLGSIWGVASSAAGSPAASPSPTPASGTGATGATGATGGSN